jgi:hypothetical protein
VKKKITGLAVIAALALTVATGVSSASASNFVAPYGGGATWNGAREGANHVVGLTGEGAISCSAVSFSGLTKESESEPTSLTVSPEISGCTWLGQPAKFDMGGCKYRFNFGAGQYPVGTMDIVGCEKAIRFAYGSGSSCETTIGNQNGLGPVTYSKTSEGSATIITAAAKINNLTFTRTGALCSGSNGTFKDGTYNGTWKIKGEKLPLAITGAPGENKTVFNLVGNGTVSCKKHTLTAQTSVPVFASMGITPSYSECTFLGQSATLKMGGCSYVLHASGGFDIVGSLCYTQPITISGTVCTVTIPAQSGASGLTYTKGESGGVSTITTGGKATGLTYTASGVGCATVGTLAADYRSVDTFSAGGGLSVE